MTVMEELHALSIWKSISTNNFLLRIGEKTFQTLLGKLSSMLKEDGRKREITVAAVL